MFCEAHCSFRNSEVARTGEGVNAGAFFVSADLVDTAAHSALKWDGHTLFAQC